MIERRYGGGFCRCAPRPDRPAARPLALLVALWASPPPVADGDGWTGPRGYIAAPSRYVNAPVARPPALAALLVVLAGCVGAQPGPGLAAARGGWTPLFDSATLDGWHGYARTDVPSGWRVTDGAIHLVPGTGDGGDLIADGTWGDFELELEWKIAACGNSGVFYRGVEQAGRPVYVTAPEMQVLDDTCHPDGKYPSHRAGAVYDLYVPAEGAVRPAGEWNTARVVAHGAHIEHWLNGRKVAEAEQGSASWNARVAASKFRDAEAFPGFGTHREGVIGIQDHGDELWVRNVRVRPL